MDANAPIINSIFQVSQEQFWQEQIKLKQESGLSRAAYCRKHDLVCSRFAYWEHKLSQPLTKLLPIKLDPGSLKPDVLCTLVFKNGNELKIHDSAILSSILSILG